MSDADSSVGDSGTRDESTDRDPEARVESPDGDSEVRDDSSVADATDDHPHLEPVPQSEALRKQQFYVGVGGGVLVGLAMMATLLQQFPKIPVVVPVLAGVLSAAFIFWLVGKSLFPDEEELESA